VPVTNGFGAFDFLFYKRKRVKNIRTIEELRIKFQVRRRKGKEEDKYICLRRH